MFVVTAVIEGQVFERVYVSRRVDTQQAPLHGEVRRPNAI